MGNVNTSSVATIQAINKLISPFFTKRERIKLINITR
jgi:hypothetical protein